MSDTNPQKSNLSFEQVKRLSMIRYMYTQGLYYSNLPEPMSSISILLFHDCAELFLQFVCNHKSINDSNLWFMDYFERIYQKSGLGLEKKEEMRTLNDIRTNIKHKGIFPAKFEIETSKVNVYNFFEENISKIYGIKFDDLNLFEFIIHGKTKEYLNKASENILNNDYRSAVENISIAFDQLITDYVEEILGERFFVRDTYFSRTRIANFPNNPFNSNRVPDNTLKLISDIRNYCDDLHQEIKSIKDNLKIDTLGIDYKKYIKFSRLIPEAPRILSGQYLPLYTDKNYTKEELEFCVDFVVESAMRIQELSFNFQNKNT